MTPAFSAGTLPAWRHPIRQSRRMGDVDTLTGDYKCARSTTLNEGDAVPGFPGMVIVSLDEIDSGISHEYSIQAEGSLANTSATKILGRSETRSLGPNFESFTERRLSWHTARKAITGVASTDVITSTAHGFSDGQRIVIIEITGGAGLTAQSSTVIGVVYFIRDATSSTFKLAATLGGAAINFTTDISAGYILAAEFCPGTPHPDFPAMYLTGVSLSDNYTAWRTAECNYSGMLWSKPYHRQVSVNGQQVSSSAPITWDFSHLALNDYSSSPYNVALNRAVEMPEVIVSDTYLSNAALTTNDIPLSQGEGGTPPNPPSIRTMSITGSVSELTYQWPAGWSIVGREDVETLNSGINLRLYRVTYRFKWPVLLK